MSTNQPSAGGDLPRDERHLVPPLAAPLSRSERPTHVVSVPVLNERDRFPKDGERLRRHQWIHDGGMGSVWKAFDEELQRWVALKRIHPSLGSDPAALRRFRDESRANAPISHPNIVPIFGWHEDDVGPFIEMEYVDGSSLETELGRVGRLPLDRAFAIFDAMCDALQAVHDQGIFHRDIKPGNILLTSRGVPKLADFGIAKLADHTSHTRAGSSMGTPRYMAPEQEHDARQADHRSDQYSLAVVLCEMLTGEPPSRTNRLGKLPRGLRPVLRRALAVAPGDRHASIKDFKTAVARSRDRAHPWLGVVIGLACVALLFAAWRSVVFPTSSAPVPSPLAAPKFHAVEPKAAEREPPAPDPVDNPKIEAGLQPTPLPERKLPEAPVPFRNSIGMEFLVVPPGEFLLGSPETDPDRELNELSRRERIARPILVGKYEVTQGQYQAVMRMNPSLYRSEGSQAELVHGLDNTEDLPVDMVSCEMAEEYCHRMSELPEERAAHLKYRLPTEVEWEYCCRAGSSRRFSVGDRLAPGQANFDRVLNRPARVGSYPPNAFGLCDTHGNLLEWCLNGEAVLKGGSFRDGQSDCRAAARLLESPQRQLDTAGFRVVCEISSIENVPPSRE